MLSLKKFSVIVLVMCLVFPASNVYGHGFGIETISAIERDLVSLDVPHAILRDEHGPTTLAVSPAINPETLSLDWNIKEV